VSFQLHCRECEVFSKNHPAPFSKVITFHKKEPFELEAFYTNLHEVPYPDPRIGKRFQGKKIPLFFGLL
jgi:heat shock protein